jgi:LmbE family N-acetylglucosaminyl deacetylase
MDPIGGRDREGAWVKPDFAVDIAATFETKRAMLAAHASQAAWLAKQHGITDHLASMERWSRRCARDFGVEVAEAFRQYRHHPYPTTPALQDHVGSALLQASS